MDELEKIDASTLKQYINRKRDEKIVLKGGMAYKKEKSIPCKG